MNDEEVLSLLQLEKDRTKTAESRLAMLTNATEAAVFRADTAERKLRELDAVPAAWRQLWCAVGLWLRKWEGKA